MVLLLVLYLAGRKIRKRRKRKKGAKKAKKKHIKQESKAMIAAKYDETDELSRKFMTPAEETSMDTARDADIATLTNYFKTTIKTKLAAANTPQKVKDLSYTWPTI